MAFDIIGFVYGLFVSWMTLTLGCEYRSDWGHFFIKAFYANNLYQDFFTKWQNRNKCHSGYLTYLGFTGVIISTVLAVFIIPLVIYTYFTGSYETAKLYFFYWCSFNALWGVTSFIIQGIDGIINYIIRR